MQHSDALRKKTPGRSPDVLVDNAALSGPSLIDQEPDLAKESGQYTRDNSGWSAGGQPSE